MQAIEPEKRSLAERLFHAICFEGIATLILAPATAWLMGRKVMEMGGLTILLATAAMIWNVIYNALFDRLWPAHRVTRTAKVRALHAVGFEGGFIAIGVTLAAFYLGISFAAAFVLEIGFILFFLPYTMLYNWAYDTLRARLVGQRKAAKKNVTA